MRQSLMCQSRTIQKTLLLLFLFFYPAGVSTAFEGFYTIHAAKYTPASYSHAKKHFDTLYEALKNDEHNYLRIEQKDGNIVIRAGKFENLDEAAELLKKIKPLARNASIVKAVDSEDMFVANLYEKTSTSENKDTEESPKTASVPENPIKTTQPSDEYYTLQVKKFLNSKEALVKFNELGAKLKKKDRGSLRIEKTGRYFSVRLGKFSDYKDAQKFLARMGKAVSGAVILKSREADEQVMSSSEKTEFLQLIMIDKSGVPADDSHGKIKDGKTDSAKQKKEVDLFFKDVSAQYGKGSYGKAAELLRKGIEKWPDNPDLYAWYGATLINMKYHDNALQQYKKAVEIAPDVSDYHAGVGLSLVNIYMDRAKESIEAFGKALNIDPNNVSALEGLGFVYASIGKKDLATEVYNRLKLIDKPTASRLYQAITQEINWELR